MYPDSSVVVAPFESESCLEETLDVIIKVHESSSYPPRILNPESRQEFAKWLYDGDSGGEVGRWVALVDGVVAGHICVLPVRTYLLNYLQGASYPCAGTADFAEISKLFTHPDHLGRGVGTALLEAARAEIGRVGMAAVLSVLTNSPGAVAFYRKQRGIIDLGLLVTPLDGEHQIFSFVR